MLLLISVLKLTVSMSSGRVSDKQIVDNFANQERQIGLHEGQARRGDAVMFYVRRNVFVVRMCAC